MIRPGRVTRPEASTKDRSHQASDPSDIQVQATPQEKSTQPRTGVPDTASWDPKGNPERFSDSPGGTHEQPNRSWL